jgi:hypothetical protein
MLGHAIPIPRGLQTSRDDTLSMSFRGMLRAGRGIGNAWMRRGEGDER